MDNIEQNILQFSELSTDEQRAVEVYVEAHPAWQLLLEDVKTLEALRREVCLLRTDDEALAYYVVARHFGIVVSAPLQRVFDQLEARLSRDAVLRGRCETLTRRLKDIAAALDPVAQFEELSGFHIVAESDRGNDGSTRADRGALRPFRRGFTVRWVTAAMLFMAVLYGGLFAASHLMQSDAERLALVDLSETEIEGYQMATRGSTATVADSLSTDALYLEALHTLSGAQTTTLGLFPRYEEQKLVQAETLLQQIIEREEPRSFLQLEAYFFLGKVHLAQGKIEAARSNFETVAVCEGQRTSEAVEILTELQEKYPPHEQSYMIG